MCLCLMCLPVYSRCLRVFVSHVLVCVCPRCLRVFVSHVLDCLLQVLECVCVSCACLCVFQVLECSWDELLQKVREAQDLDHIIAAHEMFLDTIITRSLLDTQSTVSPPSGQTVTQGGLIKEKVAQGGLIKEKVAQGNGKEPLRKCASHGGSYLGRVLLKRLFPQRDTQRLVTREGASWGGAGRGKFTGPIQRGCCSGRQGGWEQLLGEGPSLGCVCDLIMSHSLAVTCCRRSSPNSGPSLT